MRTHETWVLLNESARHHRARQLWNHIEPTLSQFTTVRVVVLDVEGQWRKSLAEALERSCRHFVAAGGDGTVGSLFDALYRLLGKRDCSDITVGAIGLGSSNDFHKPYSNFFDGVPVRIDPGMATLRDLGLVSYSRPNHKSRDRCFAVSASVGVVARANSLFNEANRATRFLKRRSPSLAMVAAALEAVATARNQFVRLTTPQFDRLLPITNLSVAKTRHLAGSLTYDTDVLPGDGMFSVNICEGMSRWDLVRTLLALKRGHFRNRPKTITMAAADVSIESELPFELEIDGELVLATRARFQVLPRRVKVCS